MEYRLLGKTGLRVSRLCFGSLTLSPLQRNLSPEAAEELLLHAFSLGVNFIDTAQLYRNYPLLRNPCQKTPGLILASKTYAYTYEDAVAAVEEARRALNRDVIELYLLHEQESVHTLRGHAAALSALYDLKAKGIIRAVGLSTHFVSGVDAAVAQGLDVVHPIFNKAGLGICDGTPSDMEAALTRACDAGMGVYLMKALGGGNLHTSAAESLSYALAFPAAHSLAVGMQTLAEVTANTHFFAHGTFEGAPALPDNSKRSLHIDSWCERCFSCVSACQHKALFVREADLCWNREACVFCGYCAAACNNFCIKVV